MDGRNRVMVSTDKEDIVEGKGLNGNQSGEVEYSYKYKVLSWIWIYRI